MLSRWEVSNDGKGPEKCLDGKMTKLVMVKVEVDHFLTSTFRQISLNQTSFHSDTQHHNGFSYSTLSTMSSHAAFQYTRSGRLSGTLDMATRTTPTPNDKEMLVRVKAAALNPVDQQL